MIDQAKQLLKDGGNVIKTRDDKNLVFIDKDGRVFGSDYPDWGLNPEDVVTNNVFRKRIEPWLTSLFQSEHLSLLCDYITLNVPPVALSIVPLQKRSLSVRQSYDYF